MTVQLRNSEDKVVKTAASADDGTFDFGVVAPGTYHAGISAADVREAVGRVRLARHEADHARR